MKKFERLVENFACQHLRAFVFNEKIMYASLIDLCFCKAECIYVTLHICMNFVEKFIRF